MLLKSNNKIPKDFINDMVFILIYENAPKIENCSGEDIAHVIYIVNRYFNTFKEEFVAI